MRGVGQIFLGGRGGETARRGERNPPREMHPYPHMLQTLRAQHARRRHDEGRSMIVSFSWTAPAPLAGAKTATRRDEWTAAHAAHFRAGQLVDARDRLPRVKGAQKIAVVRVTRAPYHQNSSEIPPDAWHAEGFAWIQSYGLPDDALRASRIWLGWREHPVDLWVLEFVLVSTICPGCGLWSEREARP